MGVHESVLRLGDSSHGPLRAASRLVLPSTFLCAALFMSLTIWKTQKLIEADTTLTNQQLPEFVRSAIIHHPNYDKIRIVGTGKWHVPAVRNGMIGDTEPYDGQEEFYAFQLRSQGKDAKVVQRGYDPSPGEFLIKCNLASFMGSHLKVVERQRSCIAVQAQ